MNSNAPRRCSAPAAPLAKLGVMALRALAWTLAFWTLTCGGGGTTSTPTPRYWLGAQGATHGPYDIAALQSFVREGRVVADTPLLQVGGQVWTTAGQVGSLFGGGGSIPYADADVAGMQRPDGRWGVVVVQGNEVRWLTPTAYDEVTCIVGSAVCVLRSNTRCGLFLRRTSTIVVPVTHACKPNAAFSTWSPCPGECFAFDDGSQWVVKDGRVTAFTEAPSTGGGLGQPYKPECATSRPASDSSLAAALRGRDWRALDRLLDTEFDAVMCATGQSGQREIFAAIDKRLQRNGLAALRVPVRVDPGLKGVIVRGDAQSCSLVYSGMFGTQLFCALTRSALQFSSRDGALPFDVTCDGGSALPADLADVPYLATGPYTDERDDGAVMIAVGRCLATGARGLLLTPSR